MNGQHSRTVGLLGATSVGVGAIVGGGIFVLAGVAFVNAGPAAIVAFALNGVLAVLTALSYSEMSTAFPESGGTYAFAKRVLSMRAAFGMGWILWFAYIVAAVLYAMGFASYAAEVGARSWSLVSGEAAPAWLATRSFKLALALVPVAAYTFALTRGAAGGGRIATPGKVVVFVILLIAGGWALSGESVETVATRFDPFFPAGMGGVITAMGYTFIALQGFDLISAIAGEVKEPKRTIPAAMLIALGLALVIYLPLLAIVVAVGLAPGETITGLSEQNPDTVMAIAVERYMGVAGYWLVVIAAILATLSALYANLLAASRVAATMARDRALPRALGEVHAVHRTPATASYATSVAVVALIMLLPDLSAAGAAASLIFLISFALAHVTAFLARRRGAAAHGGVLMPLFPVIPVVGAVGCGSLALFQALVEPSAGGITAIWLGFGGLLYLALFSRRAEVVDAHALIADPGLARMRGKSPLVLVPVANPATASSLVELGHALSPPEVGRVLLLSILSRNGSGSLRERVAAAQKGLGEALATSLIEGKAVEALMTVATEPIVEIPRVATIHDCESVLLGYSQLKDTAGAERMEAMLERLDCDVGVLRAPRGWNLPAVRRILVAVGGRGTHDILRARLLGGLTAGTEREAAFVRAFPPQTTDSALREAQAQLLGFAREEAAGPVSAETFRTDDVAAALAERARDCQLVVMGLQRVSKRRTMFGPIPLRITRETESAVIMLRRRG